MTSTQRFQIPHLAVRLFALLGSLFAFVAPVVLWSFFVDSRKGQVIDETAFQGSIGLKDELWWLAGSILDVVSYLYIGVAIIVVAGIALLRHRWWLALQAIALIVGANLTTQFLKKIVFDRPDYAVGWAFGNSLPSGHTTAAASVSTALVLVVSRKWRPWAAIAGTVYTTATGVSTLVGQWHRMSDVLAAIFVAAAWMLLICAVSSKATEENVTQPFSWMTTGVTLAFLGAAVLTGAATRYYLNDAYQYWETTALGDHAIQRDAFLGASFAILFASFCTFGFSLLVRQAVARMR